MMFASHVGVEIVADALVSKDRTLNQALFNEELARSFRSLADALPKWKETLKLPAWLVAQVSGQPDSGRSPQYLS